MIKFAKVVQSDARGQIVIPKDVRRELSIDEGTAFWLYAIDHEGILLKIVPYEDLPQQQALLDKVRQKSNKIKLNPKNIDAAAKKYKRQGRGNLMDV